MKKLGWSVLAAVLAVVCPTVATAGVDVQTGDWIRFYNREGGGVGGEYAVAPADGVNDLPEEFRSFCLELKENINFLPGGFTVIGVTTTVYNGGVGPAGDPLDARTAYLYEQFRKGTLSHYDYTPSAPADYDNLAVEHVSDAGSLQNAIWKIEGEISNAIGGEALAWFNEATTAVANGYTNKIVRVANLIYANGPQQGNRAQDVLVLVPEPATLVAWIGMGGLFGLIALRNRRKARA